ncbi:glycerophosphodiester phosphodiesterase family protein [Streptomyces sp. NPDC008001]|uniref:glycerophosphodiester phosphodiesterase family protein n=1 Tax=Streptomyces sp. NPDC008001 TaxID=3364804 RepID=UPI0036E5026E
MRDLPWHLSRPIAHRGLYGGPDGPPENSMAAFRRAVAHGVPFELDVQLTKDGALAVVHDAAVRLPSGRALPVTSLTLGELRAIASSAAAAALPATLPEVFAAVAGRVPVMVDVRRWGVAGAAGLEWAVVRTVRGYDGPVAVQSFDPRTVFRLRRALPGVPVGQIAGALRSAPPVLRPVGRSMATNAVSRPGFLSFELDALPSRALRFWQRRGLPVIGWTVHSPEQERAARESVTNVFFSGYLPSAYTSGPSSPAL